MFFKVYLTVVSVGLVVTSLRRCYLGFNYKDKYGKWPQLPTWGRWVVAVISLTVVLAWLRGLTLPGIDHSGELLITLNGLLVENIIGCYFYQKAWNMRTEATPDHQ